jgi:hypothetical protein
MSYLLHTSQYESVCCYCSYLPVLLNCPKYPMYLSVLQKFMQDLQFNSHPREFFHKGVMFTQKDMKLVQRFIHSCVLIHIQGPRMQQYFFLFNFFYLFTCAYIVWVISPSCPPLPPFSPSPPQFQAGPFLPSSMILMKKGHMHNKKDKVFLLAELRIPIQKDSYYCFHVPMCYNPC